MQPLKTLLGHFGPQVKWKVPWLSSALRVQLHLGRLILYNEDFRHFRTAVFSIISRPNLDGVFRPFNKTFLLHFFINGGTYL